MEPTRAIRSNLKTFSFLLRLLKWNPAITVRCNFNDQTTNKRSSRRRKHDRNDNGTEKKDKKRTFHLSVLSSSQCFSSARLGSRLVHQTKNQQAFFML